MVTGYNGTTWNANFGQRAFDNLPTGYKALNVFNLDAPLIDDPSKHFDVRSGLSAQFTVNDINFEADLIVGKSTSNSEYWIWADSVRGFIGGLRSNDNNAQGSGLAIANVNSNGYQSDSNWFTNGRTYTTWAWDAGSSNTAVSVGSLNSSVYNDDQTWSSSLSTNATFTLAATRAFDGDLTTLAATSNTTTSNILFTKTFNDVTSLRVYMDHHTSYRVRVNGGTWVTDSTFTSTNASWRDITSLIPANGTITSIESDTAGNNNGVNWSAVEINGKLLIDNGVSVPDVPSIASEHRVSTTAGFSIVSYDATGSDLTVGHGLNTEPALILLKSRNVSGDWLVMHKSAGVTSFLKLNEPNSVVSASNVFISASSTTFGTGDDSGINSNNQEKIAYCWSEVAGYSKFSSFEGNGGEIFIHTGFKPEMLIIKQTDGGTNSSHWYSFDTERSSYLLPSSDASEPSSDFTNHELLSNGFYLNTSNAAVNGNGNSYIFAAWASAPFKYSNAR